jgi:hypothetical protein
MLTEDGARGPGRPGRPSREPVFESLANSYVTGQAILVDGGMVRAL